MGAKVGNIGGGMVELFSWNSTDNSPQISHTFTSEELTQFKEYCSEYDLIVVSLSAEWTASGMRYSHGTDPVIGATGLFDFLNNTTAYYRTYYVTYGKDQVDINFGKDKVSASFLNAGAPTSTSTTLKIYGIKL